MARLLKIHGLTAASLFLCVPLLLGQELNNPDTVLVRVSVTDRLNRYVADLEQKDFKLQEDRSAQKITYFIAKDAPISVGFIYEDAGKADVIRNAVAQWRRTGNQRDDLFLISYSSRTARIEDFTAGTPAAQQDVALGKIAGMAPLEEALHIGSERMKKLTNAKKGLVVISEARHTLGSYGIGKNPDVQIFAIGRTGRLSTGPESIVTQTAGSAYQLETMNELDYYIGLVHAELQNEYVLGYVPSNSRHDGKWRTILVEVNPPPGLPKLTVKTMKGYYAPEK